MKGWLIFVHSVRQVFGNLNAALRVSALLYLVQVAAQVVLIGNLMDISDADRRAMIAADEFPVVGFAVYLLIAVITGLWIAVGWHRYVLTEERPGLLPPFHGDRMLGYLGKGLLIGLILIVPLVGLGLILAMIGPGLVMGGPVASLTVLTLVVYLPIGILITRLSTMLPGAALRAGVPISAGWNATKGEFVPILVLTLASGLLLWLPQPIGALLFGRDNLLAFIWDTLVNWPILMIGISVMTTLYGHYIEKRALT